MASTSILPVETIECEILPRLPGKSLVRFKLVCKSWNLLISRDDSLMLMRMRRKANANPNNLESTTIISSINGLVLLKDRHDVFGTLRFTIWNPATKQCLKIPRPSNIDDFEGKKYFSAFGFDSVANDFKIVHVTAIVKQRLVGYLYSCNGGCWRRITPSNFLFRGHIVNYLDPVIVHGSPFWLCIRNFVGEEHLVIISFNVRLETFRLLPGSIIPYRGLWNYTLLNFRDSLAVIYCKINFNFYENTIGIGIYVFNERCDAWSKMSFKPLRFSRGKYPGLYLKPRFIRCFRNGDILLFNSKVKELYYVDLQNRTFESLGEAFESLGEEEDLRHDDCIGYKASSCFIDGMKPLYEKEDEVQFLFLRKTREDIQKLLHSSASMRAAREDIQRLPM